MSTINVKFVKMTQEKFTQLQPKEEGTFYRVTTESGQDFYLGEQKLNNAADITEAIGKLTQDETSITEIKETLRTIQGDDNTEGSISNKIKEAIELLNIDQIKSDVAANKSAITILNGEAEQEGSIKKQVADAVAAIVADADTSYDTLKEISDWITKHANSASEMNTQITQNKNDIAKINELLGTSLPEDTEATSIVDYIKEAIGKSVEDLDSTISATEGSVLTGITLENGKITGKTEKALGTAAEKNTEDFDEAGAADDVLGQPEDTPDKDTVYGAKAAIKEIETGLTWQEIE